MPLMIMLREFPDEDESPYCPIAICDHCQLPILTTAAGIYEYPNRD